MTSRVELIFVMLYSECYEKVSIRHKQALQHLSTSCEVKIAFIIARKEIM